MNELPASPPDIPLSKLSQFINPYDKPQNELVRAQVWIDPADKALLQNVFPLRGAETLLLANIYKIVCAKLRSENLTFYTPSNARRAQEIITSHLTLVCPTGQGHSQHDTRGANPVHQPHADTPNQPTNLHKTTKGGRGLDGGKPTRKRKAKVKTEENT